MKRPAIIFLLLLLLWQVRSSAQTTRTAQTNARGAVPTQNATAAAAGNTYAIVIGISNYKNVRHLQFADRDAEAFAHYLRSASGGNIPADNIETFINEKATRENVADAISEFVRKAKTGDRIYFFFAGHGDMEDLTQIENGLLLLYNSPNGNYFGMKDDVLEIMELKRYLSPLTERGIQVYFIVDACHSGNLKGGIQGIQQTATALATSWGQEIKILSCEPDQLSLESKEWGGGRGLFSLELEEGLEGLADEDGDQVITLSELTHYIQTKVQHMSEKSQSPVVVGKGSAVVAKVDPIALAALKRQIEQNYPMLASANTKGVADYSDSLDPVRAALYTSFENNLSSKKLILPAGHNALADYRAFEKLDPENALVRIMRRNLAAALNQRFDSFAAPLLKGQRSFTTRDTCALITAELDSCLHILGEQHYMYNNIKARKLFIEATWLSWALVVSDYWAGMKPMVDSSIDLLEQSEKLEPNAAYSFSALGVRYFDVYEFDKSQQQFQQYLGLRPNDLWAKYSVANLYIKLKEYGKAETLMENLIHDSTKDVMAHSILSDAYFYDNKRAASLACARHLMKMLDDKKPAYYLIGFYYFKTHNVDSAKYYFELSRTPENSSACDNDIAYGYTIAKNLDSATWYFEKLLKADTTYPFPYFNLGTIDVLKGHYNNAINHFIKSFSYSTAFEEGVIPNLEIYFNKKYTITDSVQYNEFCNKIFTFSMPYISLVSILYCYFRDPRLAVMSDKIDYIFSLMRQYKEYDAYTEYHYACYKALHNDKDSAIDHLKKSLSLGFGNYFMVTSDQDLDNIRNTPEFGALLKQYFPDKVKG